MPAQIRTVAPGIQATFHTTSLIPFSPGSGYLGLETNGAMPETALGFRIEATLVRPREGVRVADELVLDYYLRVPVSAEGELGDAILQGSDLKQLERLCSALMRAANTGQSTILPGGWNGFRNRAQTAFDPTAEGATLKDLSCQVLPGPAANTVELVLRAPGTGDPQVVARLKGVVTQGALRTFVEAFQGLRSWHEDGVRQLKAGVAPVAEEPEVPAPGPRM